MSRSRLMAEREEQDALYDWATGLQAAARRVVASRFLAAKRQRIQSTSSAATLIQARVRGALARQKRHALTDELKAGTRFAVQLQSLARAHCASQRKQSLSAQASQNTVQAAIIALQAQLRGRLHRLNEADYLEGLETRDPIWTAVQSQARGLLARRRSKAQEEVLDDAARYITPFQAASRGLLARRRKATSVQHMEQSIPAISAFQAVARARLRQQSHQNMQKALAKVEVAGSVGGLQAFLRSRLAKQQATEQKKKLDFVQPDVIGVQAVARGFLARQDYREWREYLQDPHTQGALVFLQSLIRGYLARRRLWIRTSYIHGNIDKVVKVQAMWRGRAERQMYARLLTGDAVDVPTIQNYMHLLDDTDADYQRQIRTETLRREVMRLLRENQTLETEVKDLDTKIALILKNQMSLEELAKAKHRLNSSAGANTNEDAGNWKDSTNKDPFGTQAHLDRVSQRKLDLYEYLFFMLQTKAEYMARLLSGLSREENTEQDKRFVEGVVLSLFGYGQERREDYLFHKLLQVSPLPSKSPDC